MKKRITLLIALLVMAIFNISQYSIYAASTASAAFTEKPSDIGKADGFIIDHRYTDISQIPEEWINNAKADLHIAYGHTSHGSQLITGMNGLDAFMGGTGLYAWNDGPLAGALDIDDYFVAGDLGNPDRTTWAQRTRDYLDNPANSDVNVIIWSWCGQADTTVENIELYLSLMTGLETDYPNVKFVYMTGHLNGGGLTGRLHLRNEQIRTYCRDNNKILYDFADIETYDPDGTYFGDKIPNDECYYDTDNNGTRDGNWAIEWQDLHVEGVDWYNCSPAHTQPLNGNLKAYAAWWLWARIAGFSLSGDELAVDFGSSYGLWHYDGSSWSSLASWDPDDGMVEWTDGMAVDFGTSYGLWNYNGTTWSQLSAWDPEYGIAWNSGLAVDFGPNGLWHYDGSWASLATWNPDGMVEWTGGLAVNFGASYGLWNYDGSSWSNLAGWGAEYGIAWNSGLAIDFGSNGLWYYDGSSWTSLAGWNPDGMVEWTGGLAVDFDTYGTWNYDGTTWTQLAGWNPEDDIVNWADGLAVDFGPNGLWSYDGSSWTSLATWNPEDMEAWANGLAVDFGASYGLWNYSGSAWSNLSGWDSEDIIDVDLY